MSKYRIVVRTDLKKHTMYICQMRFLCWWKTMSENFFNDKKSFDAVFSTLDEAKKFLSRKNSKTTFVELKFEEQIKKTLF